MKKILSIFLSLFISLSSFTISAFATSNSSDLEYMDLSKTSIDYDFKYVFANSYNIEQYIYNRLDDKLHFISAIESQDSNGLTELYIYVYNPSRQHIIKDSELNNISVAKYLSDKDSSQYNYTKEGITLVQTFGATDEAADFTNALILKYRLNEKQGLTGYVNRCYRLADIELLIYGESNPTSFIAGKEFKFFTNKNGYIGCSSQDLLTLDMDAFHTFYRVNTDGIDKYTDIHSVYFPVPNKYLSDGSDLVRLSVQWERYKTNNGLVIDNEKLYTDFLDNYINTNINEFNYSVLYNQYYGAIDLGVKAYGCGYNIEKISHFAFEKNLKADVGIYRWLSSGFFSPVVAPLTSVQDYPLSMVFYVDDISGYEEKALDGQAVINYLDNNNWHNELFSVTAEPIEVTYDVLQKDSVNIYEVCSAWDRFFSGKLYEYDTGETVDYNRLVKIDTSDLVKLSKEEFSHEYLIDEGDVSCNSQCEECLYCHMLNPEYSNCSWFLLRFDTTSYQSYESIIIDSNTGDNNLCNSFVFNMEVIKAFDVIQIELGNITDTGINVSSVFPIGRAPTSFAADVWTPSEKPTIELSLGNNMLSDFVKKLENVLTILLVCAISYVLLKAVIFITKHIKIKSTKGKK